MAARDEPLRRHVNELRAAFDQFGLLQQIRAAQQQLAEIADRLALGENA